MASRISIFFLFLVSLLPSAAQELYREKYRPQFHFTSAKNWINDPNGLVYYDGEYHLFYQHNPLGNEWGHMSWGHAVSKDLVHWEHLPVALSEEHGIMIFSGSCVVDYRNSSGFGRNGIVPMVAIYTGHTETNQSQNLAYSLDKGRTWTKYPANPVLDLGRKDFRDPKVFWYEPGKKWVMLLVFPQEHLVQFYSSSNLKDWKWMSSFGPAGDTTGIWECPDLFEAPIEGGVGEKKWVLMMSVTPYMQYFVGSFDGYGFQNEPAIQNVQRPDEGTDYYAAIVYNNVMLPAKPISIGWVNNWNYANKIPTDPWKGAMSLPRELSLRKMGARWFLIQQPLSRLQKLRGKAQLWKKQPLSSERKFQLPGRSFEMECVINGESKTGWLIRWKNSNIQEIRFMYHHNEPRLTIDRSGSSSFTNEAFSKTGSISLPLRYINKKIKLRLFFDESIVELYANDGESVITFQVFPGSKPDTLELFAPGNSGVTYDLSLWAMRSAW